MDSASVLWMSLGFSDYHGEILHYSRLRGEGLQNSCLSSENLKEEKDDSLIYDDTLIVAIRASYLTLLSLILLLSRSRGWYTRRDMGLDTIAVTEGQIHPPICLTSFRLGRWMDLNKSRLLRRSRKGLFLTHD